VLVYDRLLPLNNSGKGKPGAIPRRKAMDPKWAARLPKNKWIFNYSIGLPLISGQVFFYFKSNLISRIKTQKGSLQ
jgi:hypothetical protein